MLDGHVDTIAMSATEFPADKAAAKEQGFDIVISSERGFAAPRGLPAEIVDRLQKAFKSAVRGSRISAEREHRSTRCFLPARSRVDQTHGGTKAKIRDHLAGIPGKIPMR